MKKLISLLAITLSVGSTGNALAHGDKPQHGGIVQSAGDLHFELVNKNPKPLIYIEDHGKKLSAQGITGILTVLKGKEKSEYVLQPTQDGALETDAEAKLTAGAKAIAAITFPDKKIVTVRFSVK